MIAILLQNMIMIPWDHVMTIQGVWKFNPSYVTGISGWSLPLEEWLFFSTIPFCCLFLQESLNTLLPKDPISRYNRALVYIFLVLFIIIGLFNYDKMYTASSCFFAAFFLLVWVVLRIPFPLHFFRMYFVSFIPFSIVNGLLTAIPVVIYNDQQNTGIRLGTIPVEDLIFSFVMLFLSSAIFDLAQRKMKKQSV